MNKTFLLQQYLSILNEDLFYYFFFTLITYTVYVIHIGSLTDSLFVSMNTYSSALKNQVRLLEFDLTIDLCDYVT